MDARRATNDLFWLSRQRFAADFPPLEDALIEPNGLLAIGGDLSPQRLLAAYRCGIFPWYSEGQPLLWWSPDPRAVLLPEQVHVSHTLAKRLRRGDFSLRWDTAFATVINACGAPRMGQAGTWITSDMRAAYLSLHALGHAHSFECWRDDRLCGGLYGVALGTMFFGESMFSHEPDASKIALVGLCRQLVSWSYQLIDCQMHTPHLARMGAQLIPRTQFRTALGQSLAGTPAANAWLRT